MNIIDHTSDDIRQIVPADMSFLSDADQQITEALHHILGALLPNAGVGDTIAVTGCVRTQTGPDFNAGYSISGGTLLHGGRLYTLDAAQWSEALITSTSQGGGSTSYQQKGCISFEEEVAAPSPVYGQSLQLDQQPHRHLVARLKVGQRNTTTNAFTPPVGVADYIFPDEIKRITQ